MSTHPSKREEKQPWTLLEIAVHADPHDTAVTPHGLVVTHFTFAPGPIDRKAAKPTATNTA